MSFINWYDTDHNNNGDIIDNHDDTAVDVHDDIVIEESSDDDNFQPIIRRKRESTYNHNNDIFK